MNSKERVRTALKHEEPDRVPVSDQLVVSRVAGEILGRKAYTGGGEFAFDSLELLFKGERDFLVGKHTEDTLELHEKLDLDFIRVGTVPGKDYREGLPRKIAENTFLYESKETDTYSVMKFSETSGQFFEVESSLEKEGLPALERVIKNIEKDLAEPVKFEDASIFETWDKIAAVAGKRRAIAFSAGLAIPMRPVWLEALMLQPEWTEIYLDHQLKHTLALIEEASRHGADFILGGGDLATTKGPVYNPEIFRRMLTPRYRKIMELCRKLNLPYIFRSDGNTKSLWDILFLETGFDGFAEIDSQAGMDLGELRQRYGQKISLIGNVDCAYTLVSGTKEQIYAEVQDCIRKAGPGGGFILASSNSIHWNVPAKNLLYMIEAGRKFGSYPVTG